MTVMIPDIPMAMPLIAPSTSPSSTAFEVPTAWLQEPMETPAMVGSSTLKNLIKYKEKHK